MASASPRLFKLILTGCLVLGAAGLVLFDPPWTVRPLVAGSSGQTASPVATADPSAYVDSIWASKLAPAIEREAIDARTLIDALAASSSQAQAKYGHTENGDVYSVVKGNGRVVLVSTSSRDGVIGVDIAPFDGRTDLTIQVGPILSGSSLRDATGIVEFSDFLNQLDFARVNDELNKRVLSGVLASLDPQNLQGKSVAFLGTFQMNAQASPLIQDVIPVQFVVEGNRP